MATTTLVYANVADIIEWGWDEMGHSEVVRDTDENSDYLDFDFYPTGIRIYFDKSPEDDGRFELGDIADAYSYHQRGQGSFNFLKEVASAESLEDFYELLIGHCTDYSDPDS